MKSPLAVGAVAAVVIALLTAGGVAALTTGGTEAAPETPPLTEAEYEAQATALCTQAFTDFGAAVPQSAGALPSDEEFADFRDAGNAIFTAMLADLAELRPPEEDEADAEELVDLFDEVWVVTYSELLDAYIALPEGQTESEEIFAIQESLQQQVQELQSVATRLGVVACAGG